MLPLLKGVKIVDVTAVILGPYATQILGDLGADVIKVEPLDGDSMRHVPPIAEPGISALFANNNRNKRSIALDLKHADGRAVLKRLVGSADVLVHNMRQEPFDRLGFGFEACRALNKRIIYCAAVGFGSAGPYAGRPAYDDVIQAVSGFAGLFGLRDGTPVLAPSIIADKVTGLHVVYAVIAALFHRERTGGPAMNVEVPMFETMTAFTLNEHLDQATFCADGAVGYARALSPARRPYRTADGWIAVLPYTEAHWRRTLAALDRPGLSSEPWLTDTAERLRRAPEFYERLAELLPTRTTAEWLAVFEEIDIPAGRVNQPADLLDDEHLRAVGMFTPAFNKDTVVRRTLAQAVRIDAIAQLPDQPPPELGGDLHSILRELDFDAEEIARLIASAATGGKP